MSIFTSDATGSLINRVELARQSIAAAGGMAIGSGVFLKQLLDHQREQKDKQFWENLTLLLQLASPEQIKALHKDLDDLQTRLDQEFDELEAWREDIEDRQTKGISVSQEEQQAYKRRAEQLAEIQTDVIDSGRGTLNSDTVTVEDTERIKKDIESAIKQIENPVTNDHSRGNEAVMKNEHDLFAGIAPTP